MGRSHLDSALPGEIGWVLGGLRRMQPASEAALKAIDNWLVYLQNHRARTHYGKLRRGGYLGQWWD